MPHFSMFEIFEMPHFPYLILKMDPFRETFRCINFGFRVTDQRMTHSLYPNVFYSAMQIRIRSWSFFLFHDFISENQEGFFSSDIRIWKKEEGGKKWGRRKKIYPREAEGGSDIYIRIHLSDNFSDISLLWVSVKVDVDPQPEKGGLSPWE